MNDPVTVTLNIDLDYPLSERVTHWGEDGPESSETQTLGDAVTERAAQILADRMMATAKDDTTGRYSRDTGRDFFDRHVKNRLQVMIEAHVTAALDGLGDTIQRATGAVSLDAAVTDLVDKYLTANVGGFNDRTTRLEKLVAAAVGQRVEREVAEKITAAKQNAFAAITQVAEDQLGQAVRQAVAGAAGVTLK